MINDARGVKKRLPVTRNDRGVALLIVLLVTALLIALIFEFSYATRISLNSAVNFRDSQRAFFLARSGIKAFITYGQRLRDNIPPGEWRPVPIIGEGDASIMIKWEDESGKIKINDLKNDPTGATLTIVRALFENVKGIDTAVVDRLADPQSDISNLTLLSGLHQYMSEDNFIKVFENLTVAPVSSNKVTININTASAEVLRSLGINAMDAEKITVDRQTTPYTDADLSGTGSLSSIIGNIKINGLNLRSYLTTSSSGYYKIFTYATVGGYTKQVEAIVNGNNFSYWRSL